MAKRKHPNLPNGYGSIKHLSGNRTNPYAVYPPATERDRNGVYKTPPALCYVRDWYTGFAVLVAYKAGTYTKGMEKSLYDASTRSESLFELSRRILSDYAQTNGSSGATFAGVYERFYDWKYNGKKEYSESSRRLTAFAYQHCSALHERHYADISFQEMQDLIDNLDLKHASLEQVVSLLKQMAKYANAERIIPDTRNVELLRVNSNNDEKHGEPFTDEELAVLWEHTDNDIVQVILIMCYSGYRIGELEVFEVDLKNKCFSGGLKTEAGKNRVVPIHSAIYPIVKQRMKDGGILRETVGAFRQSMYATLQAIGLKRHTPHGCRHTFSRLCEKYNVKENDRKRMLGHSFRGDITNQVYGHRSLEELREEIEKICC